jgi:uncharacterized protein (TIGR00369 family)
MALATTLAELRRMLAAVPFARRYGFKLTAIGDGTCTLVVPFRRELERPGGIVAGPVLMAAADVAVWLAILTRLGAADGSVTINLNTAFLAAVRREEFRCEAVVLRVGRRVVYAAATCLTKNDEIVAHHTATYARPARVTAAVSP